MGEWITVIIAFIISVHHDTSITVVQDFAVLIHVILSLAAASAVVVLKVAPAAVVPDLTESGGDWVINVGLLELASLATGWGAAVAQLAQHFLDFGDAGEGEGWEEASC